MVKKIVATKVEVTIPRPNEFDIETARAFAEALGEPFIGIFERNLKVLEDK